MMGSKFSGSTQQVPITTTTRQPQNLTMLISAPVQTTPIYTQEQPFVQQQPVYNNTQPLDTGYQYQQPLYSTNTQPLGYSSSSSLYNPIIQGQQQPIYGPQQPNYTTDDQDDNGGGGNGGGQQPCPSADDFQQQVENDPNIAQMIDQLVQSIPQNLCGVRPPQHRREQRIISANCPPRTANIRRRLPSPEADTVERTTIIRAPQDRINITIEKPTMPQACVIEKTEIDTVRPPQIAHRIVCVQPTQRECPPGSIPDQFTVASRYQSGGIGGNTGIYQQQQQQPQFIPYQQQQQQYVPQATRYIPSQQSYTNIPFQQQLIQPTTQYTTPYMSTVKSYQQQQPYNIPYQSLQSSYQQQPKYYWPQTATTQMMSDSTTSDIISPRQSPFGRVGSWFGNRGII